MNEIPHIMSLKQAAVYLGISEPTLKRRIQAREITAYKDGGYWKVKKEWADDYQQSLIRRYS
ncbi:Helix-turn-helix domain protein [compost metagenome]